MTPSSNPLVEKAVREIMSNASNWVTAYAAQNYPDAAGCAMATEATARRLLEEAVAGSGDFRLNSSRSVAVGKARFIKDFANCPRGVKVQLLGPGNVAVYGVYDGDSQWKGWYPVPGSPE